MEKIKVWLLVVGLKIIEVSAALGIPYLVGKWFLNSPVGVSTVKPSAVTHVIPIWVFGFLISTIFGLVLILGARLFWGWILCNKEIAKDILYKIRRRK